MCSATTAATFSFHGYLEHMELELMVEAGLTPMQALTAATSGSPRIIRLDRVGTIAPEKAADLLVLDAPERPQHQVDQLRLDRGTPARRDGNELSRRPEGLRLPVPVGTGGRTPSGFRTSIQ